MQEETIDAPELPSNRMDEPEKTKLAAIKIQALARGRQTRVIMKTEDLEKAKTTLAQRHEERSFSLSTVRARTNTSNAKDQKALAAARQIESDRQKEEERACVQMQALYRGFAIRKNLRQKTEAEEIAMRTKQNKQLLDDTKQHEAALKMQSQFQGYTAQIDYTQTDHVLRRRDSQIGRGVRPVAAKTQLTPTLVDNKACMNPRQKAACILIEDMIRKWASSYARAVELAPGAQASGELRFIALFSKPSKEEPIAWPVVRVKFTVPEDFEVKLQPRVTYTLEDERMVYDITTDLGRRFKESWLDRIVMDKRAIRADMALIDRSRRM